MLILLPAFLALQQVVQPVDGARKCHLLGFVWVITSRVEAFLAGQVGSWGDTLIT